MKRRGSKGPRVSGMDEGGRGGEGPVGEKLAPEVIPSMRRRVEFAAAAGCRQSAGQATIPVGRQRFQPAMTPRPAPIGTRFSPGLRAASLAALWGVTCAAQAAGPDFNREVRPILSNRCFKCHGPDEGHREAGLRLDRRDDAVAPLDSGTRAIVPGHADDSELVARITSTDPELVMPPPHTKVTLTADEKRILAEWISAVPASHGMSEAFSTGSQNHQPPHPSS